MSDPDLRFLIIGAAKSATTWLQQSLQRSPTIWMPDPELHYFSRDYDRGGDWYAAQFAQAPRAAILGEKSNSYLAEEPAAGRIRSDFPDVRLIVQMREPVSRAYSDYCMLLRRGDVSRNIADHLDPARAAHERFLHDGLYAHHLRRFYDLFPAEQILLLIFEEVRVAPEQYLGRVARHLGHTGTLAPPVSKKVKDREVPIVPRPLRSAVRPFRPLLDRYRHTRLLRGFRDSIAKTVDYPPLPPDLAHRMQDYFLPDIEDLERLMGVRLDVWREHLAA